LSARPKINAWSFLQGATHILLEDEHTEAASDVLVDENEDADPADARNSTDERLDDAPQPRQRFREAKDAQKPQQPQNDHGKSFKDRRKRRPFNEPAIFRNNESISEQRLHKEGNDSPNRDNGEVHRVPPAQLAVMEESHRRCFGQELHNDFARKNGLGHVAQNLQ
jgi:hypothetical protein